jgi:hypothetical protein
MNPLLYQSINESKQLSENSECVTKHSVQVLEKEFSFLDHQKVKEGSKTVNSFFPRYRKGKA